MPPEPYRVLLKAPYLDHLTHGSPNRPFWYHHPREKRAKDDGDIHELRQDPDPKAGHTDPVFSEQARKAMTGYRILTPDALDLLKAWSMIGHGATLGQGHYPSPAHEHHTFGDWVKNHAEWDHSKHRAAVSALTDSTNSPPLPFGHPWDHEATLHGHVARAKHAEASGFPNEEVNGHWEKAKGQFNYLMGRRAEGGMSSPPPAAVRAEANAGAAAGQGKW